MNPLYYALIGVPFYSLMVGLTLAILNRFDPQAWGDDSNAGWAALWPITLIVWLLFAVIGGPGYLAHWLVSPKEKS